VAGRIATLLGADPAPITEPITIPAMYAAPVTASVFAPVTASVFAPVTAPAVDALVVPEPVAVDAGEFSADMTVALSADDLLGLVAAPITIPASSRVEDANEPTATATDDALIPLEQVETQHVEMPQVETQQVATEQVATQPFDRDELLPPRIPTVTQPEQTHAMPELPLWALAAPPTGDPIDAPAPASD